MKRQPGKVRRKAKAGAKACASKEAKLPSIDILIRRICRNHPNVGIVVKK